MYQPYTVPTYNHAKQFYTPAPLNTQTIGVQGACANLQQLCEARCTGETPRMSYWTPTCSLD